MSLLIGRSLARALAVLVPVLDIVEGRVDGGAPPDWCEARGWTEFLLSLPDDVLARCEAEGLAACIDGLAAAPRDLVELSHAVVEASRLPVLQGLSLAPPGERYRSVPARKRAQLAHLLGAIAPMAARARRIVDVGAGRGHFTRLAAEVFECEALGLERVPERVEAAAALAAGSRASFITFDAFQEKLAFLPDDLGVGLHACGELGDRMVLAAAEAPCDLVLVSCCLQKIGGPARGPLSRMAALSGFSLPKAALGLANLTSRLVGVEASLDDMLAARENRHALLCLLRARGETIVPGEEMRGINRRRARAGLRELASRALAARGLPPATEDEILAHEAAARQEFARMRRLSLPRAMLARLTEVAVVLDRAARLEESGHAVEVAVVFDPDVTPRNLAILARAER
jgi:hypothetical protein